MEAPNAPAAPQPPVSAQNPSLDRANAFLERWNKVVPLTYNGAVKVYVPRHLSDYKRYKNKSSLPRLPDGSEPRSFTAFKKAQRGKQAVGINVARLPEEDWALWLYPSEQFPALSSSSEDGSDDQQLPVDALDNPPAPVEHHAVDIELPAAAEHPSPPPPPPPAAAVHLLPPLPSPHHHSQQGNDDLEELPQAPDLEAPLPPPPIQPPQPPLPSPPAAAEKGSIQWRLTSEACLTSLSLPLEVGEALMPTGVSPEVWDTCLTCYGSKAGTTIIFSKSVVVHEVTTDLEWPVTVEGVINGDIGVPMWRLGEGWAAFTSAAELMVGDEIFLQRSPIKTASIIYVAVIRQRGGDAIHSSPPPLQAAAVVEAQPPQQVPYEVLQQQLFDTQQQLAESERRFAELERMAQPPPEPYFVRHLQQDLAGQVGECLVLQQQLAQGLGFDDAGSIAQENTSLHKQVDSLQQEVGSLQEQLSDTRLGVAEALCNLEDEYKYEIVARDAQISRQQMAIDTLTAGVSNLQQQLAERDRKIANLEEAVAIGEKELETARVNLLDRVIELEDEVEWLNGELTKSKAQLAAAQGGHV